jgi:hypothetical protein
MIAVDVKCFICGGFFCEQTPECLPVKEEPKVEKEVKVEEPKVEEPKVEKKPKAKKAAKKSKK